jgi:ferredoxin
MKVRVDAETCIGCATCEGICPEIFEMTDEDKAIAKVEEVPPEHEDACRDAAEQCPVEAILVEEDE